MPSTVAFQWLTPVFTIFGGIAIFIVSQIVLKLVIEPVQQFKNAIGLTANSLLRHQAKIINGVEDDELSGKMLDHAAELISKAEVITVYNLAALAFQLPSRGDVVKAAKELIGIGNHMRDKRPPGSYVPNQPSALYAIKNSDSLEKLEKLLKVKTVI